MAASRMTEHLRRADVLGASGRCATSPFFYRRMVLLETIALPKGCRL